MRAYKAVPLAAAVPATVGAAAAVLEAGHWQLHADRHRIELTPRPRRRCPEFRGAGGCWISGPFPEMEACRCWSDRRTLRLPLLPVRTVDPWRDEPPF